MATPTTKIDPRYSSDGAVAVEWDETERTLREAELFWLTTVRADGRPHATPVVAARAEGAVWFACGAEEQKFVNLQANQNVLMTTGCNRWDGGVDVIVECVARHVTDEDELRRIVGAFFPKWDGRWTYTVRDGGFQVPWGDRHAMVFAVAPDRVFAHEKGETFGATTHRFR